METVCENENVVTKEVDEKKREFMKRFGKYAATAPLGMYLLMGPGASKAQASGSTCRASGKFNWGKCHIKSHFVYHAHGSRTGKCIINVKSSAIGDLRIKVVNQEKVIVKFPSGNKIRLPLDLVRNKLKGFPIHHILSDIGII